MKYNIKNNRFYRLFLQPSSPKVDDARRELILNILLTSLTGLAFIGFITNILAYVGKDVVSNNLLFPSTTLIFLLFFGVLILLSRKGLVKLSAVIFITFLTFAAIYTTYRWGADVPEALLLFALIIVGSGILVGTRFAILMSAILIGDLLCNTFLQITHFYSPSIAWKHAPLTLGDSIVYITTLLVIAVISWLFNHEIEKALNRAQRSEKQLEKQNKLLEIKVEERTEELRQAQLEKITQLYRFAELGRLASGIMHDMITPLTSASLNLSLLQSKSKILNQTEIIADKELLGRSMDAIHRMELFVQSVRKQLHKQDVAYEFSLREEIAQMIQMVSHKANQANVRVIFEPTIDAHTYGDPIKFGQIISNMLCNAIEACEGKVQRDSPPSDTVTVTLTKKGNKAIITIQDTGVGIPKAHLSKIFDPLFTTKGEEKGTGIGLYITSEIIHKNFHGDILVTSTEGEGTTFTLQLPLQQTPKILRHG